MASKLSAMQTALIVSVGVHAALFGVRIIDPEGFNRVFQDTPLEVILVNSRSKEAPTKAQAIAQANLAGGGDLEKGMATSPLPSTAEVAIGESIEEARQRQEELREEEERLLTAARKRLAAMPAPSPKEQRTPDGRHRAEQRRQQVKLLAQIERRIREENARPKKRYVSPATKEAAYALYYDAMSRKIEDRGTRNFPENRGRKLYGELTMMITIDSRGQVVDAEVVVPSNSKLLDKRAMAIVRAAAPYGAFSGALRREAEQLVIHTRFSFEGEGGLKTTLMANPGR
jgi:periplasmic protein TonB